MSSSQLRSLFTQRIIPNIVGISKQTQAQQQQQKILSSIRHYTCFSQSFRRIPCSSSRNIFSTTAKQQFSCRNPSSTSIRTFASKSSSTKQSVNFGAPRPPKDQKIRVLPFVAIFLIGTGTFVLVVNQRKPAPMPAIENLPKLPSLDREKATWTPSQVTVIFVLGGPGVGKGTQCSNLVRDYGFVHLSAGDLLRAEQNREGSEYGQLIKSYIKEGLIVPMEVTIKLLENAMQQSISTTGKSKFLIDGFPREMGQAVKFEEAVCESLFTLFFECTEDIMLARLRKRGETSGREDDNDESIRKRFRTFHETSMPVVDYYEKKGKVIRVDANPGVDEVYGNLKKNLTNRLKA